MRAILFERFGETPLLREVPQPVVPSHGALIEVHASGVCRSDWHAWRGHDRDVSLPHVPGHEFAGVVHAVGSEVRTYRGGERVTAPFVNGCGDCPECRMGNEQICRHQTQPGFTHWGSFARYVVVHHADRNLVRLPESLAFVEAASLGCRFATAFRALVDQGHVRPDQWIAIHGCGGVGLAATMIAVALGARVVAVDLHADRLDLARALGAEATIVAADGVDTAAAVEELTGGADVSLDAAGTSGTCISSLRSLRRGGLHLQVGLLLGDEAAPALPMDLVIARELRIAGSHGMQAHRYHEALDMIAAGRLQPARLLGPTIPLESAPAALEGMDHAAPGVTVITSF